MSETYASLPLRQFAAEVDLQPGEVVQGSSYLAFLGSFLSLSLTFLNVSIAARNLGWKVDESAGLVMPVKRSSSGSPFGSVVYLLIARFSLTLAEAVPGQAFGSPDFDRLARRVLALEEAIRVD